MATLPAPQGQVVANVVAFTWLLLVIFGQCNEFHTYKFIIGMAYFPLGVSIAPFVLGSFTSTIKLMGIPELLLSLGTGLVGDDGTGAKGGFRSLQVLGGKKRGR